MALKKQEEKSLPLKLKESEQLVKNNTKRVNERLHKRKIKEKIEKAKNKDLNNVKEKINKKGTNHLENKQRSKNNTFIRKAMKQPKNAFNKSASSYKESLTEDDEGVKTGVKGLEKSGQLVKKGTKKLQYISKVNKKGREDSVKNKLREHKTKLKTEQLNRSEKSIKKLKKNQKKMLRKRITRQNILRSKKSKPLGIMNTNIKNVFKNVVNNFKRISIVQVKKILTARILASISAVAIKLLPVILVISLFFGLALIFMGAGGNEANNQSIGGIKTISPEVEKWRSLVTDIAEDQDMTEYIDLALAIIEVETGGVGTKDIMQSSESAGYQKDYFQTERDSVEQGISYLKSIVNILEKHDENYLNDYKLISQAYNFGVGFASYTTSQDVMGYDLDLSEKYSREVVAWKFGNTKGETYAYENELSLELGKPYLYKNGGNFMYGEMIGQYVVSYDDEKISPPIEPVIVTSHFGKRSSPDGIGSTDHKGIDLACEEGVTPIKSLFDGEIVKSAYIDGLGNTVIVKHEENLYTTYGHMSELSVKKGDEVNTGERLGICGTTGNSTGPHLHLEISAEPHDYQVDPYPYIQQFEEGRK